MLTFWIIYENSPKVILPLKLFFSLNSKILQNNVKGCTEMESGGQSHEIQLSKRETGR